MVTSASAPMFFKFWAVEAGLVRYVTLEKPRRKRPCGWALP
jgi:hypothetical protein